MAWTKVGEVAFTVAAASTEDETLPGSPAQNDIVVVLVAVDSTISALAINTSGYSILHDDQGNAPTRVLGWKRMGATPDTVVNIGEGFTIIAGLIQVWRGADTTTAIDNSISGATGTSGDPDPPSHTTVTDGALRIVVGAGDDDDGTLTSAPTGYTNGLAGNTGQSSTTTGATVCIASKEDASADAENPGAFALASFSDAWWSGHFALKPAAGGNVTGTATITLAAVTSAAVGVAGASGTSAIILPSVTASGVGVEEFSGAAAVILAAIQAAADGAAGASGTAAVVLPVVQVAATGEEQFIGSGAITLTPVSVDGVGAEVFSATAAITLPAVVAEAVGVAGASGTSAIVLPSVQVVAAGSEQIIGTATVTLSSIVVAADGTIGAVVNVIQYPTIGIGLSVGVSVRMGTR